MNEMGEEPKDSVDGPLGKARRMADDALAYARSDEARAKLAEARKKAAEVGGAASAGAKDLLKKTGEAASQIKEKADEFSKSEKAQEIRSGAKAQWDRSRSITVRGTPWMDSPYVVAVLLFLFFPLGLYLLWKHPAWSKTRKTAWTATWAGLMVFSLHGSTSDRSVRKDLDGEGDGRLAATNQDLPQGTTEIASAEAEDGLTVRGREDASTHTGIGLQPALATWVKGDRGYLAGPPLRSFDSNVTYLAEENGWDEMIEAERSGDMERLATLCGEHKVFRAPWGSQVEILEAGGEKLLVRTGNQEEGFIQPAFLTKEPPEINKAPRTFYDQAMHVASDTMVLTEDYFPHRPGFEKNFLSEILMPDGTMIKNWSTETQGANGTIETKNLRTNVVNEEGEESALERTLPQPKFPDRYRLKGGYVEVGDHPTNEEMITWHRVLKLGAKKGDRWKQTLGRYVEEEYTVLNFTTSGSGRNAEPCAIIERRRTTHTDKGFISQSITQFDYVMGTGITHSVTNMQIGDRPMRTTATTKLLMSRTTKP
ncbi:hypothetical protein TA3x_000527 [Tundrisphaera sp. TA3]|uniref:hypothetical protein n=1 Tax=Tundrisphaera sp. TA3 TaxID=3435775 RepID=UPI003EB78C38